MLKQYYLDQITNDLENFKEIDFICDDDLTIEESDEIYNYLEKVLAEKAQKEYDALSKWGKIKANISDGVNIICFSVLGFCYQFPPLMFILMPLFIPLHAIGEYIKRGGPNIEEHEEL